MSSFSAELHVYGGPGLIAQLKHNRLPLTVLEDATNPWFNVELGVGNEVAVTQEQWQAALRHRYEALPPHLQAAVDFDYFATQLEQKRDEIEAEIVAQATPDSRGQLDLARHQRVAVLRLLTSPVNALGWQLLGSDHTGVCVTLKQSHAVFQPEAGCPKLLQPVSYGGYRRVQATGDQPFPGWFEEPEAMAALDEWRMALPRNQAHRSSEGYTLALSAGAVSRISVGARASVETRQALVELARLYQRYRNVPLHRVVAAQRTFKLQLSTLEQP
ncbi:MAG: hypothetical protein WED11_08610 [Natronospirillum sp.]